MPSALLTFLRSHAVIRNVFDAIHFFRSNFFCICIVKNLRKRRLNVARNASNHALWSRAVSFLVPYDLACRLACFKRIKDMLMRNQLFFLSLQDPQETN